MLSLDLGPNEISINEGRILKKGSMVLYEPISGLVSLGQSNSLELSDCLFYVDDHDDDDDFELKSLKNLGENIHKFFQILIFTTRNIFSNEQSINQNYNVTGEYTISAKIIEKSLGNTYLERNFSVTGIN